jgi:hypothetical protein
MRHSCLILLISSLVYVSSCSRNPAEADYIGSWTECLQRYFGSDIKDAERALLEFVDFMRVHQPHRSQLIPAELAHASTHSRLYLIRTHLGDHESASQHYETAVAYWRKEYARRGREEPSADELRRQSHSVDQGVGTPAWRMTSR